MDVVVVGSDSGNDIGIWADPPLNCCCTPPMCKKGYLAIGRDGKCCVIDDGAPNRLHTGIWPPGV